MSDGGKGSNPRPFSVPFEEFSGSHVRIFGQKKKYCASCGKTFSWCQCHTTSNCNSEVEDKITRNNEETQQVLNNA
jgi:DTW domain-containing protein YfiP